MTYVQDNDPAADGTEIDDCAIWADTRRRKVFIREDDEWEERWEMGDPSEDETPCSCANCDWKGPVSATSGLYLMSDPWERMQPGDTVPAGECPECHACAFVDEAPPAARDMAYDAAARRITDENGLTVAENVNAQDAALLLGQRLTTPAVAEIIADMLGYEAEAFDAESGDGVRHGTELGGGAVLYDPPEDVSPEVDGGDLVEAWAEWRGRLLEAMGAPAVTAPSAYAANLRAKYGLQGSDADVLAQWDRVMQASK